MFHILISIIIIFVKSTLMIFLPGFTWGVVALAWTCLLAWLMRHFSLGSSSLQSCHSSKLDSHSYHPNYSLPLYLLYTAIVVRRIPCVPACMRTWVASFALCPLTLYPRPVQWDSLPQQSSHFQWPRRGASSSCYL